MWSERLEHGVVTDTTPPAAELCFDGDQFERSAAVGTGERPGHFEHARCSLDRLDAKRLRPARGWISGQRSACRDEFRLDYQ